MGKNNATRQQPQPKPMPTFIRPLRDLVRAGKKTMTRRLVKPQPATREDPEPEFAFNGARYWPPETAPEAPGCKWKVGEVRYLREPLACKAVAPPNQPLYVGNVRVKRGRFACYQDNGSLVLVGGKPLVWRWKNKVLPSVFMPRQAARVFATVTGRRAEWLSAITDADCRAEGVQHDGLVGYYCDDMDGPEGSNRCNWRAGYFALWDRIHKTHGTRYADDPLVWVLEWRLLP